MTRLAAILFLALGCCAPSSPGAPPTESDGGARAGDSIRWFKGTVRWAHEECRGLPLVSGYEEGGYLNVYAMCLRAPVASLGGRR